MARGLIRALYSHVRRRFLSLWGVLTSGRVVPGLLDRRLIFVTGKGGVGKSTVATALGLLAARRGARTVVAELAGQSRIRGSFAQTGETFEEVKLADGLYTISIDPEAAMEEYLRVKTGPLGQALGGSRVFQAFAMATPGMRELLSMGKVWELAQLERRTSGAAPYDVVIVDSPAAGHGLGILRTPRTFAEISRVGPVASTAGRIAASVADPAFTGVLAVTTPEEMPVNETLWLSQQLADDGIALDAVVVNARYGARFTAGEVRTLAGARRRAGRAGPQSIAVGAALGAAVSAHARADAQHEQLQRLRAGLDAAFVELPFLFCEELGLPELRTLADTLGELA